MLKILLLCNDPVTLALMRASADALKECLMPSTMRPTCNANSTRAPTGSRSPLCSTCCPLPAVSVSPMRARGYARPAGCKDCGLHRRITHWVDDVIVEWPAKREPTRRRPDQPLALEMTGERLLNELIGDRDTVDAAMRRITPYVRAAAQTTSGGAQARVIAAAEADGIDLAALAFRMQRLAVSTSLTAAICCASTRMLRGQRKHRLA